MWIFFDFILKKKKSVVAFSFCIIKITSRQVINVFDRDKYKSKVIWYIGCKHTTTTCHLTLFQFLFALVCTETGKDLLYVHSGMKGEIMSWQEKKTLIQFPIYLLFIHTLTWHDLGWVDMWHVGDKIFTTTTVFFHDRLMENIFPLASKNFNWFTNTPHNTWLFDSTWQWIDCNGFSWTTYISILPKFPNFWPIGTWSQKFLFASFYLWTINGH